MVGALSDSFDPLLRFAVLKRFDPVTVRNACYYFWHSEAEKVHHETTAPGPNFDL